MMTLIKNIRLKNMEKIILMDPVSIRVQQNMEVLSHIRNVPGVPGLSGQTKRVVRNKL